MSERRASIRPPEMMNGSTNGRVSSNSSARVIRTRRTRPKPRGIRWDELSDAQIAAMPLFARMAPTRAS